jgi:hypothetical protein
MRKHKPEPDAAPKPRYVPCGRCYSGLIRVERSPGHYVMSQCECMAAFKAGGKVNPPPIDGKALACGDAAA